MIDKNFIKGFIKSFIIIMIMNISYEYLTGSFFSRWVLFIFIAVTTLSFTYEIVNKSVKKLIRKNDIINLNKLRSTDSYYLFVNEKNKQLVNEILLTKEN